MLSTMHTVQLHDLQATIDRATSTAPVLVASIMGRETSMSAACDSDGMRMMTLCLVD